MIRSKRMEIPEDLEGLYGLFLKRILQDVTALALSKRADQRQDQDEVGEAMKESDLPEAAVIALLALGLTLEVLLDEAKLRKALRKIATTLDERTKRSLATLLGKAVNVDVTGELDNWIDRQLGVIQDLLIAWAIDVGNEMVKAGITRASAMTPFGLDASQKAIQRLQEAEATATKPGAKPKGGFLERRAFTKATTAILALNATIVGTNAQGAGANGYIWRTSLLGPAGGPDAVTRDWHLELDGSTQRFDDPPEGGGTLAEDLGNPQEGINCRCVAEVFIG